MPLAENQFFEVEWTHDNRDGTHRTRKGFVLDWAAPKGATAYTVIMCEDTRVVTIPTTDLKIVGMVDLNKQPLKAVALPARQITLRN